VNGKDVTWRSRTTPSVATSSTHAEYVALAELLKEELHVMFFIGRHGFQGGQANVNHDGFDWGNWCGKVRESEQQDQAHRCEIPFLSRVCEGQNGGVDEGEDRRQCGRHVY